MSHVKGHRFIMQNIVMHLDMDSYFASVEQQDHPEYRGKPLGVCEHLGGIIIAASVEAKKWGIKTGTPVWEAKKLYPKTILVHTSPERYRFYAKRLFKLVSDYTDKVEVYSIDEVFLDLTKACNIRLVRRHSEAEGRRISISKKRSFPFGHSTLLRPTLSEVEGVGCTQGQDDAVMVDPFEEAVSIAGEIKRRMKKEVGDYLRCSIGIAENRLLAKIASDMKKPDGLVIINDKNDGNDISDKNILELTKADLYRELKLIDVPGIGRRMEKRLNELGVKTLLDLKNYPKSRLVALFGLSGHHLYSLGQLKDSSQPFLHHEDNTKSMGHMYTLPAEHREGKYFVPVLYRLCEMVAKRLRQAGLMGNVIFVHVHDGQDECFGQSKKLKYYLSEGRGIFLECVNIMESNSKIEGGLVGTKLVGVTVAGLVPFENQLSLFGTEEKKKRIAGALDEVNEKYGDFTLCRALVLEAVDVIKDSIGFGRTREMTKMSKN